MITREKKKYKINKTEYFCSVYTHNSFNQVSSRKSPVGNKKKKLNLV